MEFKLEMKGYRVRVPAGSPLYTENNIASWMSLALYREGGHEGVVIAHYGQSGPGDKSSSVQNDYRQPGNTRVVFWKGREILRTTEGGNIPQSKINRAIRIAKKEDAAKQAIKEGKEAVVKMTK